MEGRGAGLGLGEGEGEVGGADEAADAAAEEEEMWRRQQWFRGFLGLFQIGIIFNRSKIFGGSERRRIWRRATLLTLLPTLTQQPLRNNQPIVGVVVSIV